MVKILCTVCQKKCKGDVLKIGSNYVHKECFLCSTCHKNLEKGGFYLKDNRYYCPADYQQQFGVKCGICQQFVEGDVVTMLGKTFHIHCFHCQSCHLQFRSGDRATLWEGQYLCKSCSEERKEKENVSPSVATSSQSTPYKNGIGSPPLNGQLSVHVSDTGYTSTDSGVERLRSEPGDLSHPSPCYSYSSGDESSSRHHTGTRQSRSRYRNTGPYDTKYPVDYGKNYNVSYLHIESDASRTSSPKDPRDKYKRTASPGGIYPPKSPHFHRPRDQDRFSFKSSPTHSLNLKKATQSRTQSRTHSRSSRSASPSTSLNNEEPIRLSSYPGGHEPDTATLTPIERYDWPAPPSPAVVMMDRRSAECVNVNKITIQLSAPNLKNAGREKRMRQGDTLDGKSSLSRSHASMETNNKLESDIRELSRTANRSGMSKAMIQDLENAKRTRAKSPELDPISASRAPNASKEPVYKTRYDKHIFTSPSRDNRRDRKECHALSYPLEYSSTGGRSGTLPSCPSTPRPGYTQGYLHGSSRTASLPRHPLDFSDASYASRPSDDMDGHIDGQISPFTTSGYSVEDAGVSGDETTLLGGYVSSAGDHPTSTHHSSRRRRPHRPFESSVDLSYSYPSVQSWLRPSSFLTAREQLPPKIYPYEDLKVTNFSTPKDVDRNKLENHLSEEDMEHVFHMSRYAFSRLPEWKRNDLKRRMYLF